MDSPRGEAAARRATAVRTYRLQTAREELANSVSHGLGLLAAVIALPILIRAAVRRDSVIALVSDSVFGGTIILLYLASTLYHALPAGRGKHVLAILDNSAVFLLIAGTYTPFSLDVLRGRWGWTLFGVIWALAIVGVLLTASGRFRYRGLSTALYLGMGWLVLVVAQPLARHLPVSGIWLLFAGGLAYTVGVPFYATSRLRYNHLVWHLFVLVGTSCHFLAILWYSGAA